MAIRLAVGARPSAVLGMVLREALGLATIGALLATLLPARSASRSDPSVLLRTN